MSYLIQCSMAGLISVLLFVSHDRQSLSIPQMVNMHFLHFVQLSFPWPPENSKNLPDSSYQLLSTPNYN